MENWIRGVKNRKAIYTHFKNIVLWLARWWMVVSKIATTEVYYLYNPNWKKVVQFLGCVVGSESRKAGRSPGYSQVREAGRPQGNVKESENWQRVAGSWKKLGAGTWLRARGEVAASAILPHWAPVTSAGATRMEALATQEVGLCFWGSN